MTITTSAAAPHCAIDRTVLNSKTISQMTDIGLSIFAPLCGKNRGAFVLDPTDGGTYGCVEFPPNFGVLAGVPNDVVVKDANAIKKVYQAGNVTDIEVVDMLDLYTQSVYFSSPNVDKDTHACDVGGLAVLKCPSNSKTNPVPLIRAVTLAGLFVDAPWATGGRSLTLNEARGFYTIHDFKEMRKLGINTVQIPFYTSDFTGGDNQSLLSDILADVEDARLSAILVLIGNDTTTIARAASFAASCRTVVTALTLPSADYVRAARDAAPSLTLMVPVTEGDLTSLDFGNDDNIVAALDMNHATTVADVASSDSLNDRMKLYYHESLACTRRSPLEYAKCFHGVPVFVAKGFDLSIDNCILQGTDGFHDYGQCNRFNETIHSDWWEAHRKSFAGKQIFSYEKGLGWSFSAWKLYDESQVGTIDSPEKLLSLRDVAAAGLLPSSWDDTSLACLNPPLADFVLGDDTLAPSPAPPPDCGNGWWNWDLQACEYWIPPTAAPTEPCPTCPTCQVCPVPDPCPVCPTPLTHVALVQAATGGAAVALLVAYVLRVCGRGGGYTALPT